MKNPDFDVIVVGARCSGASTAMLLARQGHRVLVVDRATFPSDTLSTHIVWQAGVERLTRWGLHDAVVSTGCPPVADVVFDTGPIVLAGRPRPYAGVDHALCVRRTALDTILVDAAAAAGADLRLGAAVDELVWDGDTVTGVRIDGVTTTARITIGADGVHSRVATATGAATYHVKPTLTCLYYSYFSGIDADHIYLCERPGRSFGYAPTNDGLTLALAIAPISAFETIRGNVECSFFDALALEPEVARLVRSGERVDRFHGTADLPNHFRVPFGPGWALVGDAGYHKDPFTAQGISDAFRDAELVAAAVDAGLRDPSTMATALANYQRCRDEAALPMYELTTEMASFEPPPDDLVALLGALVGQPEAISDFLGIFAGSVPIPAFFDEANVDRIMRGAVSTRAGQGR